MHDLYVVQEIFLKEDHPLAFNLSFAVSLGLLPVSLSVKTTGCGIQKSGISAEEAGDIENISKEFNLFPESIYSFIFYGSMCNPLIAMCACVNLGMATDICLGVFSYR